MKFVFPPRQDYLFTELVRDLSGSQRLWSMCQMSSCLIALQREEIARANPMWSDEEVRLKWIEDAYGADLAANVREYMNQQKAAVVQYARNEAEA
jgi:hypothetical protein